MRAMASRNTQPPTPRVPGLPVDPDATYDEVILSTQDKAFFAGLTDERIDEILAAETEEGTLPFPA